MLTDNVIRVECQNCKAHGEVWDEELGRIKPCGSCLGIGFALEDRIHIPSPNHNPDDPMPEVA